MSLSQGSEGVVAHGKPCDCGGVNRTPNSAMNLTAAGLAAGYREGL